MLFIPTKDLTIKFLLRKTRQCNKWSNNLKKILNRPENTFSSLYFWASQAYEVKLQRTKSMINCEKRNGGFCLNFYQQINTRRFPQGIQISADCWQQTIGLQDAVRLQPVSISVSGLSSWRKRARGRSVHCFTPVTYARSDGRQRRVGRNKALPVHAHR